MPWSVSISISKQDLLDLNNKVHKWVVWLPIYEPFFLGRITVCDNDRLLS